MIIHIIIVILIISNAGNNIKLIKLHKKKYKLKHNVNLSMEHHTCKKTKKEILSIY